MSKTDQANPLASLPADLIEHPVTWNTSSDLSGLAGKSVFIRFFLQNTGLYSFRFMP